MARALLETIRQVVSGARGLSTSLTGGVRAVAQARERSAAAFKFTAVDVLFSGQGESSEEYRTQLTRQERSGRVKSCVRYSYSVRSLDSEVSEQFRMGYM